jgi:hypothetical protein
VEYQRYQNRQVEAHTFRTNSWLAQPERGRKRALRPGTVLGSNVDSAWLRRIAACRDPDDDRFLESAVNGKVNVIVSGDADLLALDTFRVIPIITAGAFGNARPRRGTG